MTVDTSKLNEWLTLLTNIAFIGYGSMAQALSKRWAVNLTQPEKQPI